MSHGFTIEYVELPNGRAPALDFVEELDDKAAARIDAFIERLRPYGNRMEGKFVKKLTDGLFELGSNNLTGFFGFCFSINQGG